MVHMNKISPKLNLKLIFEQLLFISENHLSNNRFLSKLSKNGRFCRFLLNKVKKIIIDQIFFHKIKIAQNVGFPHRFSFSGQKVTPMGLPDASGPPVAFGCLGWSRTGLESQRMTFWDPFRSHHVCLSVLLVYQDFWTFLAQPIGPRAFERVVLAWFWLKICGIWGCFRGLVWPK